VASDLPGITGAEHPGIADDHQRERGPAVLSGGTGQGEGLASQGFESFPLPLSAEEDSVSGFRHANRGRFAALQAQNGGRMIAAQSPSR